MHQLGVWLPSWGHKQAEMARLIDPQVEAFLSILCEDTEIAELELQMGSFQMKVHPTLDS